MIDYEKALYPTVGVAIAIGAFAGVISGFQSSGIGGAMLGALIGGLIGNVLGGIVYIFGAMAGEKLEEIFQSFSWSGFMMMIFAWSIPVFIGLFLYGIYKFWGVGL